MLAICAIFCNMTHGPKFPCLGSVRKTKERDVLAVETVMHGQADEKNHAYLHKSRLFEIIGGGACYEPKMTGARSADKTH